MTTLNNFTERLYKWVSPDEPVLVELWSKQDVSDLFDGDEMSDWAHENRDDLWEKFLASKEGDYVLDRAREEMWRALYEFVTKASKEAK